MINITDKTQCCGCRACANICPKNCITMQPDEEGFLYPHADKSGCVNCGLCENVCPLIHKPQTYPVLATYAAKHKRPEIKLKSSSGGVFSALAELILEEGGVVFGAAFDEKWKVVHAYAEKMEDLDKLRRSKYLQSDIGKTYRQAKEFLEQGRRVLFTGTPCQLAGLRNYLGKEYEHLLTADLICHGVPSPAVWQKFLAENTQIENIKAIDFRCKQFGWDLSFLNITCKDGSCLPALPFYVKLLKNWRNGYVLRHFYPLTFGISNLYERPSCHACPFKGLERTADFTMGDLWGVQTAYPSQYDKQGVSVLLVNTPKGRQCLQTCNIQQTEIDIQQVIAYNPYLLTSVLPHPKRAEFFVRYRGENFNKLVWKLLDRKPILVRFFYVIWRRFLCENINRVN